MKRFVRVVASFLIFSIAALFPLGTANAQSNALSITPRKNYNLKAGESVNDTISVINLNKTEDLVIKLTIVDFKAQDESGTPALIKDPNAPTTAWSIKPFTTLPQQLSIAAGKSTQVPITVKIPSDQGAGSYYSAIQYAVVTGTGKDQVTIAASSATLVFVNVPGVAREQLKFEQFGAFVPNKGDTNGTFDGIYIAHQPQVMAYRLTNQGNIAEVPQGAIVIKDMFGKTVKTIEDANPKKQIVLLGQTRRIESCINPQTQKTEGQSGAEVDEVVCKDPGLKPGRYTASLRLLYGSNGNETREITAVASFWYLPWWSIIAFVAIVALIVGVVYFLVRKIRDMRDVRGRRGRR